MTTSTLMTLEQATLLPTWEDLPDTANGTVIWNMLQLADLSWRRGRTPRARFVLLQDQMRQDVEEYVTLLRRDLEDADPSNDWIAIESFRKRMQGAMRRTYYNAYTLGRRDTDPTQVGLTEAELDLVRGMIEEEYAYLRGFTADLRERVRRGEDLTGRVEWRADLYDKQVRKAFQTGQTAGDNPEDRIIITPGSVKTQHCSVCPGRWGEYTRSEYEALSPPGPPTNWCEGFSNCACGFTVIKAEGPTLGDLAEM